MHHLRRDVPILHVDDELGAALRAMLDSELPALPVVDGNERYCGVFGEREFIAALFPAYLGTLGYAGFVPDDLDEALEQRATCVHELIGSHLNREHVDLGPTASNASIAETFLHHRVLLSDEDDLLFPRSRIRHAPSPPRWPPRPMIVWFGREMNSDADRRHPPARRLTYGPVQPPA